ncbi:hypothetical protein KAR04_03750, partial [Candidatus Calescamantes bacterium]|nr:hypothetical protein [Candidatus Calescamantes bacterium]
LHTAVGMQRSSRLEYRAKIASVIVNVFMDQSTNYLHTAVGMRRCSRLEYGKNIVSHCQCFMNQDTRASLYKTLCEFAKKSKFP